MNNCSLILYHMIIALILSITLHSLTKCLILPELNPGAFSAPIIDTAIEMKTLNNYQQ